MAPTIWSTLDVTTGGWGQTQPDVSGSYFTSDIKSMQCFGASLCIANGRGLYSSGLYDFYTSGYWVSTAPTTEDWVWHSNVGSPLDRALAVARPRPSVSPGTWTL